MQVFTLDAVVEEGEPADGGEVVAQAGKASDDQAQQENGGGDLAGFRLLGQCRPFRWQVALRRGLRKLDISVAVWVALVQLKDVRSHGFRRPEDLGFAFFADPVRHLQALQQAHEAAEVDRQRQAHHFDDIH
ncbi:hypothetical protein D3C73_1225280 [compost metagenome]